MATKYYYFDNYYDDDDYGDDNFVSYLTDLLDTEEVDNIFATNNFADYIDAGMVFSDSYLCQYSVYANKAAAN